MYLKCLNKLRKFLPFKNLRPSLYKVSKSQPHFSRNSELVTEQGTSFSIIVIQFFLKQSNPQLCLAGNKKKVILSAQAVTSQKITCKLQGCQFDFM
jgi:hypothetical protein